MELGFDYIDEIMCIVILYFDFHGFNFVTMRLIY